MAPSDDLRSDPLGDREKKRDCNVTCDRLRYQNDRFGEAVDRDLTWLRAYQPHRGLRMIRLSTPSAAAKQPHPMSTLTACLSHHQAVDRDLH